MSIGLINWYRSAELNIPESTKIEARQRAITTISTESLDGLFEIVRIYLGKPSKSNGFIATFREYFSAEDDYFPPNGNDLELKILAGAVIHNQISEKGKNWLSVALALKTGTFLLPGTEIVNGDIISFADDQLSSESRKVRADQKIELVSIPEILGKPTETADAAQLKLAIESIKEVMGALSKNSQAQKNELSALKEESNIHWWLFRNMNNYRNGSFSAIEPADVPFVTAIDLVNLTTLSPMQINYLQFLKKSIGDNVSSGNSNKSFRAFVEGAKIDLKEKLGAVAPHEPQNLCPVNFAFQKNNESDNQAGWNTPFEKTCKISVDQETTAINIAEQTYLEQLLIRELSK
jgi:hypothetical protein